MDVLMCPTCQKNNPEISTVSELVMDSQSTLFNCKKGHSFSAAEIMEMQPEFRKKQSQRTKSPVRNGTETSQELIQNDTPNAVSVSNQISKESDPLYLRLADGDILVGVAVREQYVSAIETLSQEDGKTLQEFLQERFDWWVEQEFKPVQYK